MRRVVLPLLLAAVLAGRATAQSPDSLGRHLDSLAHESLRRADSLSRVSAGEAEAASRAADSVLRASTGDARFGWLARWEDSLGFGRRIRVEAPPRNRTDTAAVRREGIFISIVRDSVVYRPDDTASMLAVSLQDVSGLWVSGGHLSRGQSAAAGALLGVGLSGLVVTMTSSRDVRDPSFGPPSRGHYARAMVLGASLGFVVGLMSGERELWHRVWPPRSRE